MWAWSISSFFTNGACPPRALGPIEDPRLATEAYARTKRLAPSARRRSELMSTRNGSDQIPLIFIHGAWLSSGSWETYLDYFDGRGFAVSAPEWPRKHGDVEEMRETAEESKGLGVTEIVDHYAGIIGELD